FPSLPSLSSLFSSSSGTTWRDNLYDASFRGVPFSVESDEGVFGRRVQVHEYPNRDKPYTEDLGRATRRLTINAYLVGDDYAEQRDRLITAIETAGPGTLIHPQFGEMQGCIDGQVTVSHSGTEGRMCRVSFQFVESGELSFPVAGAATARKLEESSVFLDELIEDMFGDFDLAGMPDFIQNDVIARTTDMLGTVQTAFKMVNSAVSAGARLLQGDLSVILMPPSVASDFVHMLQDTWRAGTRLVDNTQDLVQSITTMSGITLDPGLVPRAVWPTDSASVVRQKQQTNLVAAVIRTTAISEAVRAVSSLPQPGSLVKNQQAVVAVGGSTERQSDIIHVS
ncbi:DNA circularization N-terminal domain-containing protein, partial [Escherichia coli]|uniref:DNA circularization protein n=1 Tax=Escherichia coli TaxID=562 RepID=UPI0030C722CD